MVQSSPLMATGATSCVTPAANAGTLAKAGVAAMKNAVAMATVLHGRAEMDKLLLR